MTKANLKLIKDNNLDIFHETNRLIQNGGPTLEDIPIMRYIAEFLVSSDDSTRLAFHDKLKEVLTLDTLVGWTFLKPHGYAGDFELIDRIHTGYVNNIPELKQWDLLYHELHACVALRNRKKYFNDLVDTLLKEKRNVTILNLGSGPARDVKEYLDARPDASVFIDCVDMDVNSIIYAKEICNEHLNKVRFFEKNVLKLKVEDQYDLVWSAGMFDYFSDKLFSRLVKKYFAFVKEGGQMVIGNISKTNEDRYVMEIFAKWVLHHRSKDELKELVDSSGIEYSYSEVNSEPTGVNIFTHTYK